MNWTQMSDSTGGSFENASKAAKAEIQVPGQPRHGYFHAGGLRLHHVDWGEPRATKLVLLHGLQDCARTWDHFAANVQSDFQVVAMDHRGHGDSDWATPETYRFEDYVSDIESLAGALDLHSLVLLGHAAGGRNAVAFAARHPELVMALIVEEIDLGAGNAESRRMVDRSILEADDWVSLDAVVRRLRAGRPDVADETLAHQAIHLTRGLSGGRRVWKRDPALLTAYEEPDLWGQWAGLRCPTLIILGRQSGFVHHEVAVRMREAIPRVRLADLDGGGHWFHQEFPGAFEAAVRWFLDDLP